MVFLVEGIWTKSSGWFGAQRFGVKLSLSVVNTASVQAGQQASGTKNPAAAW